MPGFTALIERARALTESGNAPAAQAALARALQKAPRDPHLNNAMANVLLRLGQAPRALYFAQQAAKAAPDDARIISTLGTAQVAAGQIDQARATYERALALQPPAHGAYLGLTNLLHAAGELERAVETCRLGLERFPDDPALSATLATVLLDAARPDEAVAFAMEAVRTHPDHPLVVQAAAFVCNYADGVEPERVFDLHRAYGRLLVHQPAHDPARIDRDPDRPLRVGFLSPDFRRHAVATFAEPLIQGLDRGDFAVHCYSTTDRPDDVTRRFADCAEVFVDAARMSDEHLARRIVDDGVDILVDLAGHTLGHRLGVMARKPAPVQATAIGYPNTTGLDAIDARIVDPITDPPGSDALAVERLVRIEPCFLCFRPPEDAPDVAPPQALEAGVVSFGSFNILPKVSDRAFSLWVRVLKEVPGSRFVMKNRQLDDPAIRERTRLRFERAGIDPARVELMPPTRTFTEHLARYARVDIALDTYPYHGTTTTCEALWMGVPTVTRMGDVHAARVGGSLLRAVGLEGLAADSDDAFVRTAVELAGDLRRLADLRATMRDRLRASPLCDQHAYAHAVGQALRDLWRAYCRGG